MTDNPFALSSVQRAARTAVGGAAQEDDNPYSVARLEEARQAQQRAVVSAAMLTNPDDAGEAYRLAKRYQAPMDLVLRNIDDFRRAGKTEEAMTLLRSTPHLAEYLRNNPQAAQAAHDDLPALSKVEQAIGKTTRYLMGADQGGGLQGDLAFGVNALKAGSAGIFRMVSEVAALPFDFLERVPAIGGNPLRRLAEGFGMIASEQLDAMQRAELPDAGNFRQGVRSGISSAVGNTAMIPLAFAGPGGIAAALTGMVAQQGGLTYAKDRDEGVPVGTAALHASADMLAEYVGERYFGAAGFLKRLTAGQNASKLMMWEITRDIPGEIGTTLWQNFNDWALTNPEKTLQDFIAEQPDAIVQTAVAALVGGTAQVAVGRGTVKVAEALLNRQVTTAEAQADHQALVEAMQAAEASVLRERAPEQFREVLNQMASDGQVYVDAAVLNQLPPEVLQRMGNVQAELPAALAANAPVAVALADALTLLPGTPQADLFMQNARSAPDAPSLLEAEAAGKKAGEWLQNEAEKVIQQAADAEAMRASSEAVRTDLQAQLEATGRYRPAVNEAMSQWAAAFYTTMSSRLGMTPQQFYEQYPLRILGEASQQGGQVIEQGPESPAFREWFGGSKVVDEAGKPLVMYHGTGADVTTFRAKQAGAIFLTPEPIFAQAYADTGAKWLQSRGQDGAARIMPVYVRAENPFDYENPEHRAKFIAAALAVGTKDGAGQDVVAREDGAPSLYSAGAIEAGLTTDADNWAMIEEPWAQAAIKAAGFDSFYVSEGGFKNLAVYDPNQIKSAVGNRGTYSRSSDNILEQAALGTFNPQTLELVLGPSANLSTFFHETGHFFLEVLADIAAQPNAPQQIADDMNQVLRWFGVESLGAWNEMTLDQQRAYHERWAESIEQYIMEGRAPSAELAPLMRRFRAWLLSVYQSIKQFLAGRVAPEAGGPLEQAGVDQTETAAFKTWFGDSEVVDRNGKPLVVYHGTEKSGFDVFDPARAGENTGRDYSGIYFTNHKLGAETYSGTKREANPSPEFDPEYDATPGNYPVYLKMANPYVIDFEGQGWDAEIDGFFGMDEVVAFAQDAGFDGVIAENVNDEGRYGKGYGWGDKTFVVFHSGQIKSATKNDGTFDANDPSILSQGGPQQPSGIHLNDDIRRVMDRLLATDEQIAQAEAAAGMVPEDEATATAKERLQARSIRDLKWIVSARDKVIADIQKQAEVERRRVRMEVRAEVMSQPVYRAWQFLTGKGAPQETAPPSSKDKASRDLDTTKDSLLGAIAKLGGLSRESAARDLSVAADSFAAESGVFGAPVFRKDGGRSADDMREALTEAGYLRQFDEFGRTELRELEDLVAEELAGRPQYSMRFDYAAAGRREELPAWAAFGKLQTSVLRAWYGEADTAVWRRLSERRMTSDTTGVHPDVVADAFGFGDGRALVQALVDARPPRDMIEELTAQRLLEEHGELVDPAAIRQAANEAVHNEARAKALATELAAQSEMLDRREPTGQADAAGRPRTVNVLLEAAKQFGAQVAARTQLRDLKAKAWAHTAAERRAAQRWQDATKAGKTEEAVQAKRDQVLNNAAAKALTDALAEAREIGTFFKRVTKGSGEAVVERGRDADIVDAARAVLQAYGVESKASRTATENLNALRTRDPDTFAAVEPIVAAATSSAQPLDALTVEELQGLHEQVQALWHLAKRSRQMEVDGNLMDIEDAAAELNARLVELGVPAEAPGQKQALTKADERRRGLQFATSALRRVEQWAEGMDGKFGGPFLRYVFQPVKDAADRYRAARIEYRKRFQALVDAVAPLMPVAPVEAPELGYTFGRGHNGVGMAELLHAILHTGNDSNKRKLLLGRGWGDKLEDGTVDTRRWDAFINRLISQGVLRREHFDFAQGVWDLLESTKIDAQRTHRDVFGYHFDEVTANPVTNALGTWRGGYVPAQADPAIVTDAALRKLSELENESMAFSFPTTSKGFTKGRVEYNRPLQLDLRTLPQHIDKVLMFTHLTAAVRGVDRLLRQPDVSQPLGRRDPSVYAGMLLPWLNRSAKQLVETPIVSDGRVSRVASVVRARAGAALMFANLSNTVQQITGMATAAVKVKPALLLQATAQYLAHPRQTAQAVSGASSYMADRMSNEIAAMQDDLEQIVMNPSVYEQAQRWSLRHAFFLQRAFDNVLGPIVWTGAYNQAVAEGMSDTDAVRFADGTVRQTQGSTLPEDISRMETGNAWARLFTQFTGYFNMLANTNATAIQQIARDVGLRKGAGKALYVLTLGMLMPLWVAEAIAIAFRGGPDDEDKDGEYLDDWIAAVLGMGTIKGLLAAVPGLGQLANAGIARWNNNPADDRVSMSPAVSLLEGAFGAPHSIYKAIVDDANPQRAVRDVASFLSVVTGLPVATALARPAGYAAGMAADKIEPTSPADAARGLVTGTASPESKQR